MVVLVGFLRVGKGGVGLRTLVYMIVSQHELQTDGNTNSSAMYVQAPQKLVKTQTPWASRIQSSTSGSGAIAAKDPGRSIKRRGRDLDFGLWRHSSQ